MGGYAVIDLETTGLFPGMNHRVVEIGVVQLSAAGDVEDRYGTLVNPLRDLGATEIHGLTAADVRCAPAFAAIAGDLLDMLAGRVLVAHNLPFDLLFLAAELGRLTLRLPVTAAEGLCTMRLADDYLPTAGSTLAACCAAAGLEQIRQHAALDDATASAELLRCYLAAAGQPVPWQPLLDHAAHVSWPAVPAQRTPCVQRGAATVRHACHFLGRLAANVARSGSADTDAYLAVLDDVLIDRYISDTEADALVDLAAALGIDVASTRAAHERYLDALGAAAWADGVVTDVEQADLAGVARLLGLAEADVTRVIARNNPAQGLPAPRHPTDSGRVLGAFRLAPGDLVVFTGEMSRSREEWERIATAAGLAVNLHNVTKKTRLVVAADPDSMSGKARRAHEYGIPVVTEEAFARMLHELAPS